MSNIENKKIGNIPSPAIKAPMQDDNSLWLVIQIPMIMKIIFSYLCFNDLKNFRLVSYVCSQVGSMALFKKTSRVALGLFHMEHLKRLIHIIRTSSRFPCTKFCIRTGQTKNATEDAILEAFLHVVSPFITELGIEERAGQSIFCQNPNIIIQYPSISKIKIMHKYLANQDSEDWTNDVEFLANVIRHSPLLDTINCDSEFITTFLNALNSPQGRNIKHLELRGIVESQQLELVTSLGLSLNSVTLEFIKISDISQNSVSSLLESQSDTLQQLEIGSFPAKPSPEKFKFPSMNALTVLKVCCKFRTGIHFSDILYAEQFPALIHLNLSTYHP